MDLYNLDKEYKKFIETLVDGYVIGKNNMKDGSNPFINHLGMEVSSMFFDYTDDLACALIFHKAEDSSVNICYVYDSKLINNEGDDSYEAQERFIKIKRSDFIYKLSLLKWLEDSGYIILVDDASYTLFETGQITDHDREKWTDNGSLIHEENVKSRFVYETLSRFHNCRIIPSAQLIDIRLNDFKTTEQRRFECELQVAKDTLEDTRASLKTSQQALEVSNNSFVIALITLIATILFGIWQTCSEQSIDSQQIDSIVTAIREQKLWFHNSMVNCSDSLSVTPTYESPLDSIR